LADSQRPQAFCQFVGMCPVPGLVQQQRISNLIGKKAGRFYVQIILFRLVYQALHGSRGQAKSLGDLMLSDLLARKQSGRQHIDLIVFRPLLRHGQFPPGGELNITSHLAVQFISRDEANCTARACRTIHSGRYRVDKHFIHPYHRATFGI
jgi:hypothetical protein